MTEIDFTPLTSLLGIASTSYIIQLGQINNKWAVRILKGKDVIGCLIFKDIELKYFPETNQIINWVLYTVPLSINPHQVWKTVHVLLKQARKNILSMAKINE